MAASCRKRERERERVVKRRRSVAAVAAAAESGKRRLLIYGQAVSLTILSASRLRIANNGCAVAISTTLRVFSAAVR